jgi:thiosulfate/3-mercaptopyruvate sulfurtransferase
MKTTVIRWLVIGAVLLPGTVRGQASLIQPDSLTTLLGREGVAIIDVRQSWTSYLQNHLPGATWLNIETLRAQQEELPFQLLTPGAYAELFRRNGVDPSRPVVVYSAGDQFNIDATFTAWLLSSAGAKQVLLLDGGFARWELERRPLTQKYPRHSVPTNRFQPARFLPETASLPEVEKASKGNGVVLVDARPAEQFGGSAGAQLRRGHIPGAVSHPWKSDLEQRDLVLVWKSRDSLAASYRAQGITPDRNIIVYCNSGTEASHVFFALKYILGYPRVRIYTGAWSQWAEREDLPIE